MPMEQEKTSNPARRGQVDRGQVDRDYAGHRPTDRGQVDRGQVGVIVLIVLAVIATVVMLLSNSEVALRLALLASLWSAVIGFFLVTRYRRQAESAEQRVADHERFVREQQESARAAGTGAGVPAQQVLADGGSNGIDPERFEEMWESIRAELSVIRTHLEELQDREFGYEPAALQAEARRIQELEQHAEQHTAQAGFSAGFGASSGAPSRDAIDGKLGSQPSQPQPNPLSALISEREQEKQSQRAEYKPAETVKAEPAAAKAAAPKSAQPKPSASTTAATKSESAPAAKPTAVQPAAAQKTTAQNTTVQNRSAQNRTAQAAAEPRQRSKDPVFDTSRFHAVRWDSVGETSKKPSTSAHQQPASASESSAAAEVSASSNRLHPYNASAQGSGSHAAPQEAASSASDGDDNRPHRRRRDENTSGISVAELLKRTKK